MKCWRCQARNARGVTYCWACGVRLRRSGGARPGGRFRPEALRYFSTASTPLERHRAWLDSLVLVCTVLFGLLLAYFITDVLPAGASPRTVADAVAVSLGDASRFLPLGPPALPRRPVGAAQ